MIDIEGVGVSLGGEQVLADVSLHVEAGRALALVGPNGAGKTTLLRCLNGVLTPDEGRVTVDGEAVGSLSRRAVARLVATVPQNTSVAFDFAVRDIVAMGRTPHRDRFGRGDDGTPVERAMERVDVARLADRSVGSLSGGERQRVLLARALAQGTPVLALDEPTASLDVAHQVRTLELVRSLVDEGRTVVAAIHNLDLAARYFDTLAVLADGGVLAIGPPEEVLTDDVVARAFGGRPHVHENPVTGMPSVTVLDDLEGTTE